MRISPRAQISSMSQNLYAVAPHPAATGRPMPPEIAHTDPNRGALRQAVLALEGPSYVARLSALARRPMKLLGQALPRVASDLIARATQAALTRALRYALWTIPTEGRDPESGTHIRRSRFCPGRWAARRACRQSWWNSPHRQPSCSGRSAGLAPASVRSRHYGEMSRGSLKAIEPGLQEHAGSDPE